MKRLNAAARTRTRGTITERAVQRRHASEDAGIVTRTRDAAAEKQYSGRQHWEPVLTAAVDFGGEGDPPFRNDLNDRIVQPLLKRGANVSAKDYAGDTVLSSAAWYGRLDLATDFLNRGASVANPSALDGAVSRGNVPLARLLIAHGADVNGRNILGDTPLTSACRFGRTAVARMLLDHGASLALRSASGKTALQTAQTSRHTSPALVQLLTQYQEKRKRP